MALLAKTKIKGFHRDKGDGCTRGLYLAVTPLKHGGGMSLCWVFRFTSPVTGRPRLMGLGPCDIVSLADARDAARQYRLQKLNGIDPIDQRKRERAALRADQAKKITFKEAGEKYIAQHKGSWESAKHAAQWTSTLKRLAYPVIGTLAVGDLDTPHILKILEPLWKKNPSTAGRLQQRIARVLDWARARGYRQGDNPARWIGHLDSLLPARHTPAKAVHMPALAYSEIPLFMTQLREQVGQPARALEMLILTALRTNELVNGVWGEVDLAEKVWTVPAERMKMRKPQRIPLSDRAIEILKSLPREQHNPHIFVGEHALKPISDGAMLKQLKRMRPDLTAHGFRSTFRDWASERTNFPREVAEQALAHAITSASEAAYRRGDLFEKRQRLMDAWSSYCCSPPSAPAQVIPLQRA